MNINLIKAYAGANVSKRLFFGMPTLGTISPSIGEDDQILKLLKGSMGGDSLYKTVCLATDKGIHIFVKGYYSKVFTNDSGFIPFESITNVVYNKNLGWKYTVVISTAGDTFEIELIEQMDAIDFVKAVNQRLNSPKPVAIAASQTSESKICPDCAEDVKLAANKCRYCGYMFSTDR